MVDLCPHVETQFTESVDRPNVTKKKRKLDKEDDKLYWNEFHGCYCLVSKSPKTGHKGRTYVGYTVNPNRRIKQHNSGQLKGGAKKTDSRGPWDMVFMVHGFMNQTDALRFEWAWQNPDKSRRLRACANNINMNSQSVKKRESPLASKLRVACRLLNTSPWCNTTLTLRWLLPVGYVLIG